MTEEVKKGIIYMVILNDGFHSYRVGEIVERVHDSIFINEDELNQFLFDKHVFFIGEL